jgi:hypothetical protein
MASPKAGASTLVKPVVQGQETAKYGGLPVLPSCLSFAVPPMVPAAQHSITGWMGNSFHEVYYWII